MCGIFGAINFKNQFSEKEHTLFSNSLNSIAHRGPDNQSHYHTFNEKTKTDVFLGHRRLSIIDLSEGANQPFIDDDLILIFNGEIFNYLELQKEYFPNENFKTNSDTEIITKVYRKFGKEGFNLFNGMWAFALYDTNNNQLILSRDRFNIKPLYYVKEDNKLFFGSEIRSLLPFLKNKEANKHSVYQFIRSGITNFNTETYFKGINKVPAKHSLIIDLANETTTLHHYWEYNDSNPSGDVFEQFRYLLEDSVKIRLRSDVEVGSLLSGGIDSTAITLLANQQQKIKSFSVVSEIKAYSEENFIDKAIRSHGFENVKFNFNENDVINYINTTLEYQEEPYISSSIIAQYLIFKTIKEKAGIKVVLSGQGADEILMGYVRFFFFSLGYAVKKKKLGYLANTLGGSMLNGNFFYHFDLYQAKKFLQRKKFSGQFDFLTNEFQPIAKWQDVYDIKKSQINDVDKFSIPALAHYEDRNSMAHSIEVRHPFLDHRLVDFSVNLQLKHKIHKGWTKYILRKAMKDLDKEIRWRKDKKGFTTPQEKWLKNELKENILAAFDNSVLQEMGMIDAKKFQQHYKDFVQGKSMLNSPDIFRTYITELWAKKYFG